MVILSTLLVLVSRSPFLAPHLLTFDNVNLALALEEFDPARHQPQPPGYPLFVAEARALLALLKSPETTFQVLGVLASGVSVALIGLLGRRMFSPWTGRAASLLFLLNPALWSAGIASPLRVHLALIVLGVAYCCWRMWQGEAKFLYAGSALLGLGSGFRPELLVLLLPLWLASVLKLTRSPRRIMLAFGVLGASAGTWLAGLMFAVGGPLEAARLFAGYFIDQSQRESIVLGGTAIAWSRMASRVVMWNALAAVGMVLALPFVEWRKRVLPALKSTGWFLAIWAAPSLAFQFLLHTAHPGHVLTTVPIWCLLGGLFLAAGGEEYSIYGAAPRRETLLIVALLLNALLFIAPFEPPERPAARGWSRYYYSVRDAAIYARFETSAGMLEHLANSTSESLERIAELRAAGDVRLIVWHSAPISWRQGTYYVRDLPFCVLSDPVGTIPYQRPARAALWRFNRLLETTSAASVRVRLPASGRVIWLVNPGSLFHQELEYKVRIQAAPPVFYTLAEQLPATFQVGHFVFERDQPSPAAGQ